MDRWIQRSSLSLKELTPPCPMNSARWHSPLHFLLSRPSHHPSPNPTHQRSQKWDKNPCLRDTTDRVRESRPGIKFTFHWVKRKPKFFKTTKSNLCELELLLITNTQNIFKARRWSSAFELHMNCAGGRIYYGTEIPCKPFSTLTPFTWALAEHSWSKGVYNLRKLMKPLHFLSALGCCLTFDQCTFMMSRTSAPLILNVIAGSLCLPKKQSKWYWNFVVN